MSRRADPPDRKVRDRILRDLDTTLLVEAAAGTGKTTSLVGRMTALVASGRCTVDTLADFLQRGYDDVHDDDDDEEDNP